jgi:putative transposase
MFRAPVIASGANVRRVSALANAALDARVAALHAASKRSYGRPRLVASLGAQGTPAGHERVRQSLLRQGLKPV